MALGSMLRVIMEHPLLMLVTLVDVALIALIAYYLSSRLLGKKQPGQKLKQFLRRIFITIHPGQVENVESLYEYVINTYIHRGVVPAEAGRGFRAREKVLESVEGEERQVVKQIFESYEGKMYGGGVWNEEKTVAALFDQFRSV